MTTGPSSGAPDRLAPHAALTKYYDGAPARQHRVTGMFDASAPHYDWITGMMSFGSGRAYRRAALQRHGLRAGMSLLDVGAGTGDIALLAQDMTGADGYVAALDPSPGMVEVARRKGVRNLFVGRGDDLPFEDRRFDLLTMGYALRHVEDLRAAFAEYLRVLKPGASVLLLEITRPRGGSGYRLLKVYLKHVVPFLTRVFRGSREAGVLMSYYWDTIENCVPPETILGALAQAGFADARRDVVLGIFSEYRAWKPAGRAPPD
jgi:demethylmenaquinone methyltransferase/2-methoxy-6-polyprenyl-1,4-benzoquinol methylase